MPIPNTNVRKFPAFHPPIWGFQNQTRQGLRRVSYSRTLYVDGRTNTDGSGAAVGNDTFPGTDPEHPKATIQSAIDAVTEAGTQIIVAPASYTENLTIGTSDPEYCAIIGAGSQNTGWYPEITASDTTDDILHVRAIGWLIEGLLFNCPASAAGILLQGTGSDGAFKTTVRNCVFDGLYTGLYGIEFYGAPHRVTIEGCEFIELYNVGGTAYAIVVTNSADSDPYECKILDNLFWENNNHVSGLGVRGWNVSLFRGNVFGYGALVHPTMYLNLAGGAPGGNIVSGNYFCGAYTEVGGYWANTGNWNGNYTESAVAGGVVSPNKMTIATPP